eukprot:356375-Chlamydomonas_euryale.AAC.2
MCSFRSEEGGRANHPTTTAARVAARCFAARDAAAPARWGGEGFRASWVDGCVAETTCAGTAAKQAGASESPCCLQMLRWPGTSVWCAGPLCQAGRGRVWTPCPFPGQVEVLILILRVVVSRTVARGRARVAAARRAACPSDVPIAAAPPSTVACRRSERGLRRSGPVREPSGSRAPRWALGGGRLGKARAKGSPPPAPAR